MLDPTSPASEKSIYFDAPILHVHMSGTPITEGVPAAPARSPIDAQIETSTVAAEAPAVLAQEEPKPASDLAVTNLSNSPVLQTEAEVAESRDVVNPKGTPEPKSSPASTISPTHHHERAATVDYASTLGKPGVFTNVDGHTIVGSTFINGAGTTGPNATAEHNDSLHQRAASADAVLSEEQKAKIAKNGAKGSRQLAKIIKTEAKVEKQALNVALKELAELQKIQKTAHEAKAQAVYTKALTTFQKHEAAFLAARSKYEASQALLTSNTDALEISRSNAKEATARMQEKSQEVDGLRTMFDVDEKERAVKLGDLAASQPPRSRFSIRLG
ncbi:hypothetical protein C8R45DRAFT_1088173 [Mycena sanguinolenta]|nr:hypothetical protein C8R45DRAFT_1088173 [Mycena sanguinolenta]